MSPTNRPVTDPPPATHPTRHIEELEQVVIRFAGDSGDGMQLAGDEFSRSVAAAGRGLRHAARLPFGDPGAGRHPLRCFRLPDPVFLARGVHLGRRGRRPGGDEPRRSQGQSGGCQARRDGHRQHAAPSPRPISPRPATPPIRSRTAVSNRYRLFPIDITELTAKALQGSRTLEEGHRPLQELLRTGADALAVPSPARRRDGGHPEASSPRNRRFAEANVLALCAPGSPTAMPPKMFPVTLPRSGRHPRQPGRYRSLTGNQATALGFVAASELSGLPLFLGSYPITPASDILHTLAALRHFSVTTFQAEDEIAGVCSAIGAAFGGALGITTTSGPGMALKTEAIGLAVMTGAAAGDRERAAGRARPPGCPPRSSSPTCCRRSTAGTARRRSR